MPPRGSRGGSLQLALNLLTLARGPRRIREELAAGAVSERFADLLRVAWVYGGIANLCIPALLLLLAGPLRARDWLAWQAAVLIGFYYVLVGLGTYALGIRKHAGLLVFVLLGLALLVPAWAARGAFRPCAGSGRTTGRRGSGWRRSGRSCAGVVAPSGLAHVYPIA